MVFSNIRVDLWESLWECSQCGPDSNLRALSILKKSESPFREVCGFKIISKDSDSVFLEHGRGTRDTASEFVSHLLHEEGGFLEISGRMENSLRSNFAVWEISEGKVTPLSSRKAKSLKKEYPLMEGVPSYSIRCKTLTAWSVE